MRFFTALRWLPGDLCVWREDDEDARSRVTHFGVTVQVYGCDTNWYPEGDGLGLGLIADAASNGKIAYLSRRFRAVAGCDAPGVADMVEITRHELIDVEMSVTSSYGE